MLRQTRALLGRTIADLTEDQLLHVPSGFRNNILWNVGHVIVAQQALHYRLAGREMYISDAFARCFGRGTSPQDWASTPDVDEVRRLLVALPDRLLEDYRAGGFEGFRPYATSTGPVLQDIEDAIAFNNFHEGLHTGVVMSLKKLVA